MGTKRRSQHRPEPDPPDVTRRIDDAVADLSTYALTMELQCHRLHDRVLELTERESPVAERRALMRERAEIAEELGAFRGIISALVRDAVSKPGTRSANPLT